MDKTLTSIKINSKAWVSQYGDMLFQYVLPRVGDTYIAEDLVQDTFLSALRGLKDFRGEASEKNWLFTILKNKIIDYYRKKGSAIVIAEADTSDSNDEWFNESGMWRENKRPNEWKDPENLAEQKEFQKVINQCKEHLKEMQQQVFILKYLEDQDSDKICKVLGITPSNYWVLIHRARLQMRDCIEKNWFKK
jgi:RNA polymerase sigma-70 factor (ECF subfamily)